MRDWLIKQLGGFTEREWMQYLSYRDFTDQQLRQTITELQALIPVSAVTPKKRGRPRKAA